MFNTFLMRLSLTPRSTFITLTDRLFSSSIHRSSAKKRLVPRTLSRKSRILNNLGRVVMTVNERGATRNVDNGFNCIKYTKNASRGAILHEKHFFVIDLETLSLNNVETPFMMGVYKVKKSTQSAENIVYSTDLSDVNSGNTLFLKSLDFIVNNSPRSVKNVYVFAHNGAKFDSKVLLPIISSLANNNIIEINNVLADGMSTLYEIRFRYKGKTIVLRDSIKLLGASVANLGKIYLKDTTSHKMDIDMQAFQNWFANNQDSLPSLVEEGFVPNIGINKEDFDKANVKSVIDYISLYCIIDCKVVALSLQKFSISLKEKGYRINLDSLLTISSVSINVFTTYFYNKSTPIASIPAHTSLHKFIKNAYIGGRTEVLGSGLNINNVYHFDIPGMYAQCMNMKLPFGNPVFISKIDKTAKEIINTLHGNNIIGFFQATVTCPPDLWLPVLGNKIRGKLTFNTGTFSGTWTTYELELALEKGYKVKLSTGYIFLTREILSDYSTTITAIKNKARSEDDSVTRAIAKLLRNSLYGKFAASYHDNASKIVSEEELTFMERAYEITRAHDIGNNYWLITYNTRPINKSNLPAPHLQAVKNKINKITSTNPVNIAISATITSYGRIMLYKLWRDILDKGGTLLYSDTDSVFASFPEAPYGKTFRGFVWPEDVKGNDTFKRVLFIAPKMYYLETVRGNIKFAVKGVGNTGGYTYDEVARIFVNKEKLTFKDQVSFKNMISKGVMKGVTINNNLTKVYDMFNSVKREWVWIGDVLSTQPVEIKDSAKTLSSVQEFKKIENKKTLIINLNDRFKWDETRSIELPFGTQNIDGKSSIVISMNITDDIQAGVYHATATAIANSDNMKNNNVKRVVVTLHDTNNNMFKTVIQVNVEGWTNYSMDNLIQIINDKMTNTIIEYARAFNPDIITFKVTTVESPFIISPDNNIEFAYNLSTTSLSSKKTTLKYLQEQIELITQQQQLLEGCIDLPEDDNISADEYKAFKSWKKEVKTIIDNRMIKLLENVEGFDKDSKEFIMYNRAVTRAFYKTFEESGRITLHSFAEKIIDFLHSDRYTEKRVKDTLSIAWTILSELTFRGVLDTYKMKSQDMKTKTVSLYTSHTFFIRARKSPQASKAITNKFILSKVSLSPIQAHFPEGFSKDITYTLNKLNSTPVIINIPYLNFLLSLEYTDLYKMLDLKLEREKESIGLAWANSKFILVSIAKWYTGNGKRHFYMKYIHDFRGRLYPELTHVRHMSHKFLRPLFITKDSETFTHNMLIELIYTGKTDNKALEIWFNIVMKIPGIRAVNLKDINSSYLLLNMLASYKNTLGNWNDIARLAELIELRKEGSSITPAPQEYDAKARVIQHAAAVSGNENILAMIGMVEKEGVNKEDIYMKTANSIVDKLESWLEEESTAITPSSDTITTRLEKLINDLKGLPVETLRNLAKKPLITKAYNARDFRIIKYVKEDLKDAKLNWRREIMNSFMIRLKASLTDVIINEIDLMNQVQGLIKNLNTPYGWTMRPNSDFIVYCDNPIKQTRDVNLKSPISGLTIHTTINVLKQGQNKLKNRNRIFVNIIHAIDALHIALIIKHTDNYILPIHDAILVKLGADMEKIQDTINRTFKSIHDGNRTFKRIIEQVETQTGNVRGIVYNGDIKITKSLWIKA